MFRSLFRLSSNSGLNDFLLYGIAVLALAFLGPIKLFQESEVPITLQSLLIVLIPILLGWRIGFMAVLSYLLLGALNVPVFVGYSSGYEKFMGPTGGFLIAFAFASMVAGLIAEMKSPDPRIRAIIALVLGHTIILTLGLLWLWQIIPEEQKWLRIRNYFGPATFVKIAFSYILIQVLIRIAQRKKTNRAS